MENIKKIEKSFEGKGELKGFQFNQIGECENGYFYKVTDEHTTHYEIIEKIVVGVCENFEKKIYSKTEFKEVYPKTKHFGKTGWCFREKTKANKFWEELKNKQK